MTDMLDERRRGLEEEYFHKKNQEALEKIRAKIAVNKEAKAAAASPVSCPRCSDTLKTNNFEGVNIDICDKCSGVWLDSGEYEQTHQKEGWVVWTIVAELAPGIGCSNHVSKNC